MKILFAAYRDWAIDAYEELHDSFADDDHEVWCVKNVFEFDVAVKNDKWDAIVLIGWSWKVSADVVNNNIVVGMHPSDLPMFAGGSPIQNQILSGITKTNATLFKLNEKFDQGEIVDKEPIDLTGHLKDVFASISKATIALVERFVANFPNNTYLPQTGEKHVVKRLKPEDSRLGRVYADITGRSGGVLLEPPLTVKELWDHIRCHEDPYPNAYFEDETGRLVIKLVEFESK